MKPLRDIGNASKLGAVAAALLLGACACATDPKTESAGARVEVLGVTRLQAQNPKALADWYSSRFRLTFKPDGSGYLSKDDTALGPLTVAIDQAPAGRAPRPIHIFFFVRNLDRVLGQLSDVGTSPRRIETDEHGRPKAIVYDPEGNEIELVQR
jgi:predicted enzyme related to lactoylglutathione lyase